MDLHERAYKFTLKELKNNGSGLEYLYASYVPGLLGAILNYREMSLCQEVIDGMKDGLIDYFFEGIDPEWDDYGTWQWFENMSPDWFIITPQTNYKGETVRPDIKCTKMPKDFKE